ncbi:NAD-binding protein [Pseudanabaena galeata UHCC 0370]|uniref:NAD-binding protein n=1 Tax=Pseudanabaena galeata UHCC 0370 TaxID=3110310 RepID=A0ABU5TMM1_9CYAN|nr:NAD-binding protein [Pseudanabaena galeata]MEA5479504.1 NAD-binding protein [Pseudanabaena galeata UHCC 0370]
MRSLAVQIKSCLLDLEIKVNVTVRQKPQELHILLESTYFGDRQMLLEAITKCCHDLDQRNFKAARIYAFWFGQPLPQWVETIEFDPDHLSINNKEKETPKPTINSGTNLGAENEIVCDRFIVCGLGSLGQHSVFNLKKFAYREYEVKICAIDKVQPEIMEFDNFSEFLEQSIILGDCRRSEILIKAGIDNCRAILLVTSNENVNIETAIAARRLNPDVHIVVRSSRQNLNQLLKDQLGNFVALDPVDLPAASFAVAGLGGGTLGLFQLGDRKLRVVERVVEPNDYRFLRTPAYLLHKKYSRLLSITDANSDRLFFQWEPDTIVQVDDRVAFIEFVENDFSTTSRNFQLIESSLDPNSSTLKRIEQLLLKITGLTFWKSKWHQLSSWFQAVRSRRLILWGVITAIILWGISSVVLFFNVPNISWQKATSTSMILLLGGFGDVFGGLDEDQVPLWVVIFCLSITLISLLFVLGVVGLIADSILSSKFEFFKRSLPLPSRDHIILIGFGRLGQRIADLLFKLQLPFVIVSENPHDCDLADKVPWFTGNIIEELSKTNLAKAKSILSVTDDQMLNLETALLARDAAKKINRQMNLAIRTYDRYFSENLAELLPSSQSFCAYALSAEAFAGAAFGENMLSLFRLNQRTVLVAEYIISENDTLIGKNLSQIAYGYVVVPVYLKTSAPKADGHSEFYMPSDDEVMKVGDRLTLLASISGLRRIELGNLHLPKRWQLRAKPPLNSSVLLDAGNKLKNISGCDLEIARRFMQSLPAAIELPMYDTQAYRLGQVLMRLLPIKIYPL